MSLTPEQEEHRKKVFAAIAAGEPFECDASIPLGTSEDVLRSIGNHMAKSVEELLKSIDANDIEKIELKKISLSVWLQVWKVVVEKNQ